MKPSPSLLDCSCFRPSLASSHGALDYFLCLTWTVKAHLWANAVPTGWKAFPPPLRARAAAQSSASFRFVVTTT